MLETYALQILEYLLPDNVITPTSFETVGHIAHLNLRDEHLPYKKLIAQVTCKILEYHMITMTHVCLCICLLIFIVL